MRWRSANSDAGAGVFLRHSTDADPSVDPGVASLPCTAAAFAAAAWRGNAAERLAWSLALGIVIGINPSVGITTVLVVLLAWIFGLSQVASQIGTHVVAPLHLLLFIPFMQLGVHVFHTRHLPFDRHEIHRLSHHPLGMVREMWLWQWHALVVWGLISAVAMPVLATYLRRGLVLLMRRHRALLRDKPALR